MCNALCDNREVLPTKFPLQAATISFMQSGDAYEHLGMHTGYQGEQTPVNTICELMSDVKRID